MTNFSRAVPAQHAELQQVRVQTAGYHRRDLDALREAGSRYAELDPAARAAFLARLSSVLASLQWCGLRLSGACTLSLQYSMCS